MRFAIVQSVYSRITPSGENNVVEFQIEALRSAGHEVVHLTIETDRVKNEFFFRLRTFFRVSTGIGRSPIREILEFNPDVLMIHNLFPNFGSSWIKKLKRVNPNIISLLFIHNFRHLCASGTLFLNGNRCEKCLTNGPRNALLNRCYRNSFISTLPWYIAKKLRISERHYFSNVHGVCYLSHNNRMYFDKYLPKSKSSDVIQNFVPDNYSSSLLSKKNVWSEKWVAVGRLETEKGFSKLVENWPDGLELDILGVGTEYRLIEKLISGKPNINLVGYVAPEHLEKRLHSYCGAIHPSLWVEVAPLTILEFHRAGLPVVYLGDNFTPAKDGIPLVGLKVDNFSSQEIFAACKTIMENRIKYSNDSRANYIEYYSPKVWLANLFRLIEKFEGVESKSNTS